MTTRLWRLLTTPTALSIAIAVLGVIIEALASRIKTVRS